MTTAPLSLIAALVFLLAHAAPAAAQATRTWVSGLGDDANPCSRTAPCKTFAGAISKTAPGGEISVLDPGGFGAVTITKSISIVNDGVGVAGILVAGTNGIVINAGAADVINLRGIIIDGQTTGLAGINFIAGGSLNVQNCVIKNFKSGVAAGLNFAPGVTSQFSVQDTVFTNNGTTSAGAAILVKPTSTAV